MKNKKPTKAEYITILFVFVNELTRRGVLMINDGCDADVVTLVEGITAAMAEEVENEKTL